MDGYIHTLIHYEFLLSKWQQCSRSASHLCACPCLILPVWTTCIWHNIWRLCLKWPMEGTCLSPWQLPLKQHQHPKIGNQKTGRTLDEAEVKEMGARAVTWGEIKTFLVSQCIKKNQHHERYNSFTIKLQVGLLDTLVIFLRMQKLWFVLFIRRADQFGKPDR